MNKNICQSGDIDSLVKKAIMNTIEEILPEVIQRITRQKWLTSSDVTKLLQCSKRHLQYLRDSGQIKFYKVGKCIRFHIEDVEKFIKSGGEV